MGIPTDCPDDNQLVSLIEGQLSEEAVAQLEAHLDRCRACQAMVDELAHVLHPATDSERAPAAHATIGRYEVRDELGTGATGVVYRAYDPELRRQVAIKLLRPDLTDDDQLPTARARLLREARLLSSLSHPNVVPVYDVGSTGDEVFVAVELIVGRSLADWQQDDQPSWQAIVEVYAQVGRGLAAAHQAGLVHRDVKPANLMLGEDGRVRVTDFGLATATGGVKVALQHASRGEPTPLTPSGAVVGTLAYMAPEQYVGRKVDARADQYAYCVSLGEALTGERPGPGATAAELRKARNRRGRPALPDELLQLVARGLSAQADQRFPAMTDLVAQLETLTAPADAGPGETDASSSSAALTGPSTGGPVDPPARSSGAHWGWVVVAALAAVVLLLFWLIRG